MSSEHVNSLKFKLVIAYDGTAYEGWQVQKTGTGVQQIVETALAKLFPERAAHCTVPAARTPAFTRSAWWRILKFRAPNSRCPSRKLALALNAWLPEDIRVLSAARAPEKFHARFDAGGKQYRYFVWNHAAMNPLLRQHGLARPAQAGFEGDARGGANYLSASMISNRLPATRNYEMKTTVRTLTRCDIKKSGAQLTFIIEGDGFLYKMCRGIVGTIVQVGLGKFPPDEIKRMLAKKDRRVAGMTAPAHGLVLWKVFYSKSP